MTKKRILDAKLKKLNHELYEVDLEKKHLIEVKKTLQRWENILLKVDVRLKRKECALKEREMRCEIDRIHINAEKREIVREYYSPGHSNYFDVEFLQ